MKGRGGGRPARSRSGHARSPTGRTFAEGPADYDIAVAFDSSDYNFTFGNSSVSYSYTGTIAGFDGATDGGGEIDFVWTKAPATAYGSNYMTFDNITVVPEPSAAVLSGLAASLLLAAGGDKRPRS